MLKKNPIIKHFYITFALIVLFPFAISSQDFKIEKTDNVYIPAIEYDGENLISSPVQGLWSIATDWENNWSANWHHAKAMEKVESGPWIILRGEMKLDNGTWYFQDAYKKENKRVKVIRRFEWKSEETLEKVTLAIRWKINALQTRAFFPNILYYGNPSGEKNGKHKVPTFHGASGEEAIFEEHRFTMPFAALEWQNENQNFGAALHTLPSPIAGANIEDQWWSLGVQVKEKATELVLLSGPVAYNDQRNVVKGLQTKAMDYENTFIKVTPGTIIEKTFYLEAFPIEEKGTAFQQPIYTSLDIFKPFYLEDFPTVDEIIEAKYRFAKSRWIEGENFAGFNMYPDYAKPRIVLGWAGQSEAPTYALQALAKRLGKEAEIKDLVQRSLDHICTSPVSEKGFPVRYEVEENKWHSPDPVSEGQAMNSIALAIKLGRENSELKTDKWETFLEKACTIHAARILNPSWNPVNTAEAFYIAPLLLAAQIFDESQFSNAALKAADYYANRHLDMEEPYWGGTLDATCEDKEGAWGAFQGFLAAYEFTKEEKYLKYAKHAGDVVISYTVVWDIPLPAGRMSDHFFKTRGWTGVSPQNQHLDVYGVVMTPAIYKLGIYTKNDNLKKLAAVMYRSCGQMINPFGSQGEQLQNTNFAQHGDMSNVYKLRGGYSESWTVFWITAHFLHAAAQFEEMGVRF